MGDTMDFQGATESITAPSMALSLCNVDSEGFTGLTFGVSSVATNLEPQVSPNEKSCSQSLAPVSVQGQTVLGFGTTQWVGMSK